MKCLLHVSGAKVKPSSQLVCYSLISHVSTRLLLNMTGTNAVCKCMCVCVCVFVYILCTQVHLSCWCKIKFSVCMWPHLYRTCPPTPTPPHTHTTVFIIILTVWRIYVKYEPDKHLQLVTAVFFKQTHSVVLSSSAVREKDRWYIIFSWRLFCIKHCSVSAERNIPSGNLHVDNGKIS